MAAAFKGVYGAWVNVDGFTVGEQKEIFLGMRIFELAKQLGTVKHYVWSSLDYASKVSTHSNLLPTAFYNLYPFTTIYTSLSPLSEQPY